MSAFVRSLLGLSLSAVKRQRPLCSGQRLVIPGGATLEATKVPHMRRLHILSLTSSKSYVGRMPLGHRFRRSKLTVSPVIVGAPKGILAGDLPEVNEV